MSHMYLYQDRGSYQVRNQGVTHEIVSGQGNRPGARGAETPRITLTPGSSNLPPAGPTHTSTWNSRIWHVQTT